jgi:hypothetical protein
MKRLFLQILLLLFVTGTRAQELPSLNNSDNNFVGGIILGGNVSRMTGTYYQGYHKLGLTTGLTVYTRLKNKFWTSIELLYSQKGTIGVRQMESVYTGSYFEKYYARLNYIEVPVLLHYFDKRWYHFSIGASYSVLMKSKEDLVSYQPTNLYTQQSFFNQREYDIIIGGGLHVNKNLFLNIRYQHSVTPVRDAFRVPQYVGYGNQLNNMFAFQFVYMMRYKDENYQ